MRFVITSPSRLHMSLLDLNGELGRIDGGFGMALSYPHFQIEFSDEGPTEDYWNPYPDFEEIVRRVRNKVQHKYNVSFDNVSIYLREMIEPHIGLGSKTQLMLSIAKGLCYLKNIDSDILTLTSLVNRGGTSGIGYRVFENGGFIVDLGHSFGKNKEKSLFEPSSASFAPPALTLTRLPIPDHWIISLFKPLVKQGAHSFEEKNIFETRCPLPIHDVEQISHRLLMQILPGVLKDDLEILAEGLWFITNHGFKALELKLQDPKVSRIMNEIHNNFRTPVGMSSFGPTVFTISPNRRYANEIEDYVLNHLNRPNEFDIVVMHTEPVNHGYTIS